MRDTAFKGTRVVEVAAGTAAGVAGRFFADLGAEVVRIEQIEPAPERAAEQALLDWTRLNKRTLRLPNGAEPGTSELEGLVANADLVITDLSAARWNARFPAPEALVAANPHLVCLDITAFGRSGPYAEYAATDLVEMSLAGYVYVCGLNDREPLRLGVAGITDMITGVNGAGGAMIALSCARRTGWGQVVDVTRLETMLGSALTYAVGYPMTGAVRRRSPTRIISIGALVPCADGHVLQSTYRASSETLFLVLHDERILEERFANVVSRELHQKDLYQIYCDAFRNRTKAEIMHSGQEIRLQNAMVQSPFEIVSCPQHTSRHFFQPFRLASGDVLQGPALPIVPPEARSALAEARADVTESAEWLTPGTAVAAAVPRQVEAGPALAGLKVLELTFAWAGPFMGRILSDYGAEVVKVEAATRADTARGSDQVDLSFGDNGRWLDRSPAYMIANVNKRQLGMELTQPAGHETVLDLVRWADVVIENFTPRVLPNLGLGWELFHEINPAVIMISATGFGHTGPYHNFGAWGWGLEAQSGVTYSTGYLHDPDPVAFGPTIPDTCSATLGLTALLAALEERRQTGEGQWIDLSQYEGATFATLPEILRAGIAGGARERVGNRHPWMAPQGLYACEGRDEWLAIAVTSDAQWRALCGVVARPDLLADPALADHDGRWRNHDRIDEAITAWTAQRTKRGAMEALQAAGVPAGAVNNTKDLQFDPQIRELDYYRAARATETGLRVYPGPWHHLARTPGEIVRGPSNFGEDNALVLREILHYPPEKVEELLASGAFSTEQSGVVQPPTPGLPVPIQLERGYTLSWDTDYVGLPAEIAKRHAERAGR